MLKFTFTCEIKTMDAKLIIKLDKQLVEKAKEYAASRHTSLSGLIESYLKALVDNESILPDDAMKISPFVKSMETGVKIPADLDYKKAYGDYLSSKYK